MNYREVLMSKLNFRRISIMQSVIASASILSFSISFNISNLSALAQHTDPIDDPRWYAFVLDEGIIGLAAAKVSQLVVDAYIDPADAAVYGFVAHPLWLATGTESWVEVGYDKEPITYGANTTYYWASATSRGYTDQVKGYATVGNYYELKIIWNRNTSFWEFYFGGQKIGQAANVGGPSNSPEGMESGLETTSNRNSSPRAPVYGMKYATLSNFTWRDWPSPSLFEELPARVYWVNQPFSAETRMP